MGQGSGSCRLHEVTNVVSGQRGNETCCWLSRGSRACTSDTADLATRLNWFRWLPECGAGSYPRVAVT
jgi:hypothetical protein